MKDRNLAPDVQAEEEAWSRKFALDEAFDVLREWAADDPDPVSMLTEGDEQKHDVSVVVLRGQPVIEMFRQWAERNFILHSDREVNPARSTEE